MLKGIKKRKEWYADRIRKKSKVRGKCKNGKR